MALVFEIEVQDNGTAKIVKFETTAGTAITNLGKKASKTSKSFALLTKGLKGVSGAFGKVTKFLKSGIRSFAIFAAAIGGAVFVMDRFFKQATRIFTVRQGFQNMAASVSNATVELKAMQEGSKGLIDNLKLMENFNNALALRIPLTEKSMGKLTETALTLGRALGVDVNRALESLVIGIGRQSRLVLDNLGLIVSTEIANKKYARALGKTVKSLSLAEQKQAFFNEAMEQAQDAVDKLGGFTLNAADQFTILKVKVINAIQSFTLGVAKSSVLGRAFEGLGIFARNLAGGMDFVEIGVRGAAKAAIFATKGIIFLFDAFEAGAQFIADMRVNLLNLSMSIALLAKGAAFLSMAWTVMTKSSEEGLVAINAYDQTVKDFDNTILELTKEQDRITESTDEWINKSKFLKNEFVELLDSLESMNSETQIATDLTAAQVNILNKQRDAVNFVKDNIEDLTAEYMRLGQDGDAFIRNLTDSLVQQFGIEQPKAAILAQRALGDVVKAMEDTKTASKGMSAEARRAARDLIAANEAIARSELIKQATFLKTEEQMQVIFGEEGTQRFIALQEELSRLQEKFTGLALTIATFGAVIKDAFEATKNELLDFGAVAQEFGAAYSDALAQGASVTEAFGTALKQAFAERLRAISQEAAVEAIFQLGLGFATLFFNPAESAAHFTAAGILFGVATAAGVGAAAIGGGGGAASSSTAKQERRQRDGRRQEQAQDKEGRLEINIIGDFIGDERFIDQFAAKITEAGKKRNVFVGVSEAADSAASVAAA